MAGATKGQTDADRGRYDNENIVIIININKSNKPEIASGKHGSQPNCKSRKEFEERERERGSKRKKKVATKRVEKLAISACYKANTANPFIPGK